MLSRQDNELLTRVGPGTPLGNLFRRYWIPALLTEQLPAPDGAPVRLRLLGEDLVAFRASDGRIGLLGEHCAHRGTSLFFGRNEECGLRCVYHGWKFDVDGNVVDTPAEPGMSPIQTKIHHTAYPCIEAGGIVFAYLGPKAHQPVFPRYPWLGVAQNQIYIAKSWLECNYLQGLEGDCDSAHLNYLHRIFKPDGRHEFINRVEQPPEFEFDELDCGVRAAALRTMGNGNTYARISHFIMPCIGAVPVGSMVDNRLDGFKAVYQVPADDENTWRYDVFFKYARPFGKEDSSKRDFVGADYKKLRNKRNNYLQDRQMQKTVNYTGITEFLNQDACATESMGAIVDRSVEHLGASDAFIIQLRRFLLRAVKDFHAGKPAPGLIFDPAKADLSDLRCEAAQLPAGVSWRSLYANGAG